MIKDHKLLFCWFQLDAKRDTCLCDLCQSRQRHMLPMDRSKYFIYLCAYRVGQYLHISVFTLQLLWPTLIKRCWNMAVTSICCFVCLNDPQHSKTSRLDCKLVCSMSGVQTSQNWESSLLHSSCWDECHVLSSIWYFDAPISMNKSIYCQPLWSQERTRFNSSLKCH